MYNKKQRNSFVSTFAIKVVFLILLFVGVPYILVSFSKRYEQKASGIIEQQNTLMSIQSESVKEMKVLTQAEANTLSRISDFIGGTWTSEQDGRYKIQIDSNNKFEEFYDEEKEGYGVWRVFSGLKNEVRLSDSPEIADTDVVASPGNASPSTASSSASSNTNITSAYTKDQFESAKVEEPKYFFQKQQYEPDHKGEIYIYQIQQLDSEKFVLVFKNGAGKPLVFIRATSPDEVY